MKSAAEYLKRTVRIILLKPHKIIPHIKTSLLFFYPHLFKGYASEPHTIYIGITRKCNLKCKICDLGENYPSIYSQRLSPQKDLSFEVWRKFIDEVSYFRPNIEICAAEPLLYPEIGKLLSYIKKKRMVSSIYTNGYLLEKRAKELVEAGIQRINISVDGLSEVHDKIREASGLFMRICRGLKKIRSLPCVNTPIINVNFTINPENFHCIEETYEYLKNNYIPFDQFTIIHTLFVSQDMADEHNLRFPQYPASAVCVPYLDISKIDYAVVKKQVERLLKKYPTRIRNYPNFNIKKIGAWYSDPSIHLGQTRCMFIYNSANVTSDGSVIPFIRCVGKTFGNIEKSSFKEIWNSKDFREFRCLNTSKGPFPICNRCSANFVR